MSSEAPLVYGIVNTNGQLVYWFPVSEKLVGSAPNECGGSAL